MDDAMNLNNLSKIVIFKCLFIAFFAAANELPGFKDIKFNTTSKDLMQKNFDCSPGDVTICLSPDADQPGYFERTLFGQPTDIMVVFVKNKIKYIEIETEIPIKEIKKLYMKNLGQFKTYEICNLGDGKYQVYFWVFDDGRSIGVWEKKMENGYCPVLKIIPEYKPRDFIKYNNIEETNQMIDRENILNKKILDDEMKLENKKKRDVGDF